MDTTFQMIVFTNITAVLLTLMVCFFSCMSIGKRDGNVETLVGLTGIDVFWICLAAWKLREITQFKARESGKENDNAIPVEITSAIALAAAGLFNGVVTVSTCIYLIVLVKKKQRVAPEPASLPVGQPLEPQV